MMVDLCLTRSNQFNCKRSVCLNEIVYAVCFLKLTSWLEIFKFLLNYSGSITINWVFLSMDVFGPKCFWPDSDSLSQNTPQLRPLIKSCYDCNCFTLKPLITRKRFPGLPRRLQSHFSRTRLSTLAHKMLLFQLILHGNQYSNLSLNISYHIMTRFENILLNDAAGFLRPRCSFFVNFTWMFWWFGKSAVFPDSPGITKITGWDFNWSWGTGKIIILVIIIIATKTTSLSWNIK